MIRIALPDEEVRPLDDLLRTSDDPTFRPRVQIALLARRGRRHPAIAADTGPSARSVQRWRNAYLDRGLDGLRPRKAPGAKPKLTADLVPVLGQWVIDGPAEQGLDRANWTYAERADHLYKTRGLRVSPSAVQAFGATHGIRPYRPTYRVLRGDPAQQATARDEIAALKDRRSPANSSSRAGTKPGSRWSRR